MICKYKFCSCLILAAASLIALTTGCGTTTQKFATEQLLISDAVDQAVGEIDFGYLANQDVYLDSKFLRSVKGVGFANSDYIVSTLRERLAAAGCRVQEDREEARIIVEPRVGALGTDGHEVTYGIPQTGQITTAAAALSSSPVVPAIPEISFGKSDKQLGIAKINLFAYDRETKVAVWQSGLQKSESSSTNTWVMGAGPFQKGSIHEGFRFAGRNIRNQDFKNSNHTILAAIDGDELDAADETNSEERIADQSKAGQNASSDTKIR